MLHIIFDLDMTLVNTREVIEAAGPEPLPIGSNANLEWVEQVTNPHILASAGLIKSMEELLWAFENSYSSQDKNIVYITGRREDKRQLTQKWLEENFLDVHDLYMRPNESLLDAGAFKASIILQLIQKKDTVIVVDDDPDGSVERECRRYGWTHLKVTTY